MADSIQVFRGGADPLSNLHVCPEGCKWSTAEMMYDSVEKEFQHNKVQSHGLVEEVDALLSLKSTKDIMFQARDLVPEKCDQWIRQEISFMEFCCRNKFNNCPYAHHALLCTRAELVEGTMDKKWGSGLDAQRMRECHPNY